MDNSKIINLYQSFTTAQPILESAKKIKRTIDKNDDDPVLNKIILDFLYTLWNSNYVTLDDFYTRKNGYMVSYTLHINNHEKYIILILDKDAVILDTSDFIVSAKKEKNHFVMVTEEVYGKSRYTRKKEPF